MPRSFEESKELFMKALSVQNWNDLAIHATDLLHIDENLPWVWANRAHALHKLGHHLDALLNYDRALALEESAISYSNKGATYADLERTKEALECYEKAIALNPNIPQTYMNMGHVYKWRNEHNKSVEYYAKSVEVDPLYADGHLAYGISLLRNGDFENGWAEYEWRWKSDQLHPRGLKEPRWTGQDLTNKSLLIYGEQGLGDIIQFARYARVVKAKYPTCLITLEAKQPVKRLLQTVPEVDRVINFGEKVPNVDYVIPMLSVPALFETIPSSCEEYFIEQEDIDAWNVRLQPLFERFTEPLKVGICWAGMARTANTMAEKVDSMRSTTLASFLPLATIPNIAWISLQKGPPAEQIKKPPCGMTIGDFTEDMYDFYETCAVIKNCDLVITVDTAVAHAAASVGKLTWLLSRWDGCWRWMGDDKVTTPWYPAMTLFHQKAPHDWAGVMQEVAKELRAFIELRKT